MRVLSFIPALLLAAASFVAAAPASLPVDTSCVSTGGNGNDAALQPTIAIITNATSHLQPLSVELANLKGDSCTPEAVSKVVIDITAVVSTCVAQLNAAVRVDLSGLDVHNLCVAIYDNLSVVLTILNNLVTIVVILGANAVVTIRASICGLLDAVTHLVGCLDIFVVASVTGVLGPVIGFVGICVKLLVSIVVNIKLGAN